MYTNAIVKNVTALFTKTLFEPQVKSFKGEALKSPKYSVTLTFPKDSEAYKALSEACKKHAAEAFPGKKGVRMPFLTRDEDNEKRLWIEEGSVAIRLSTNSRPSLFLPDGRTPLTQDMGVLQDGNIVNVKIAIKDYTEELTKELGLTLYIQGLQYVSRGTPIESKFDNGFDPVPSEDFSEDETADM
jgi:hypothetical protein